MEGLLQFGLAMQREYEPLIEEFIRLLLAEFEDRVVSVLLFGSVARERHGRTAMLMCVW